MHHADLYNFWHILLRPLLEKYLLYSIEASSDAIDIAKNELKDTNIIFYNDLFENVVLPKKYNESTKPLDVRELIGYVPWYFNLPDDEPKYAVAWNKIMDTTRAFRSFK